MNGYDEPGSPQHTLQTGTHKNKLSGTIEAAHRNRIIRRPFFAVGNLSLLRWQRPPNLKGKHLIRKITLIAASSVIFLSAFGPAIAATEAKSTSNSLYCWKSKLYVAGDDLVCNWADSAAEACKGNPTSNISKVAIANEPIDAKRCENGQWLVRVSRK